MSANREFVIATIAGAALLAGVLFYFLLVQPRRRARPYREAVAILAADQVEEFERADDLLRLALESGLRRRERADARFARAYVLSRMGRCRDAAGIASDLLRASDPDREAVYLCLWISLQIEDHDAVVAIYDEHAGRVGDLLDARLIVSVSLLERARAHWQRREIDAARERFQRVRDLQVLADRVPGYLDDHQLTLGTVALFDDNVDEARAQFQGSVDAATAAGRSSALGELGLLLVQWRGKDQPDIEDRLAEVADRICAEYPTVLAGKDSGSERDDDDPEPPAPEAPDPAEEDGPLDDAHLLVRGVLLWQVLSLLRRWGARRPRSGPPGDADLEELGRRAHRVRAADPFMGDPWLVQGLVEYFTTKGARQQRAVRRLEASTRRGVNLPEVLEIIHREQQLEEQARDALRHYLTVVRGFLANPKVPVQLREQLRERLARFEPFRQTVDLELATDDGGGGSTVADIQARGDLLHSRIQTLLRLQLEDEQAAPVQELLDQMREKTATLRDTARAVDEVSGALMGTAGEFLLRDEQISGSEGDSGSGGAR